MQGPNIPVSDPYNMYFTPDGKFAIVVAEAERKLDFSDPHTFALQNALAVPNCAGVNHIDFSADGSYFIATCEFGGRLVKVDTAQQKVLGYLDIGGMPQDIKIDPAGKVWYVSDMDQNGVHLIDGDSFKQIGFIPTGPEAHGLYPSRDAHVLYVSNRGGVHDQGSVSVIDFATRKVIANWPIPAPSTPDMGGVSPTARRSGCRAAATTRCTGSTPRPASWSPASRSATSRTASPSGRSPAATRSATPESCAKACGRWSARRRREA